MTLFDFCALPVHRTEFRADLILAQIYLAKDYFRSLAETHPETAQLRAGLRVALSKKITKWRPIQDLHDDF